MKANDTLKVITDLCQLDIDAVGAYERALKNIDDNMIHKHIEDFRLDHVKHIEKLNEMVKRYGGTPLENKPDFKGLLIEGFTALRSITGTIGALKVMEINEIISNRSYKEALDENPELPVEVKELIAANLQDEERHLSYIRQTLASQDK